MTADELEQLAREVAAEMLQDPHLDDALKIGLISLILQAAPR